MKQLPKHMQIVSLGNFISGQSAIPLVERINVLIDCVEELQEKVDEIESKDGWINQWGRDIDLRLKHLELQGENYTKKEYLPESPVWDTVDKETVPEEKRYSIADLNKIIPQFMETVERDYDDYPKPGQDTVYKFIDFLVKESHD